MAANQSDELTPSLAKKLTDKLEWKTPRQEAIIRILICQIGQQDFPHYRDLDEWLEGKRSNAVLNLYYDDATIYAEILRQVRTIWKEITQPCLLTYREAKKLLQDLQQELTVAEAEIHSVCRNLLKRVPLFIQGGIMEALFQDLQKQLQDALQSGSKGLGCPRRGNLTLVNAGGKTYCPECGKDCS